jgi:hypothetical protein
VPKKTRAPGAKAPSMRSRGSARYATREEQLAEVFAHHRKRDQKVYDALLTVLTCGDGRVLTALGPILDFVVTEARARPRRMR